MRMDVVTLVGFCLRLLAAGCVGVFFFLNIASLPLVAQLAGAVLSAGIFYAGLVFIFCWVKTLRLVRAVLLLCLVVVAVFCIVRITYVDFPSPERVNIEYSKSPTVESAVASDTTLWGRHLSTYFLHPVFAAADVPHALDAHFSTAPSTVYLKFSKPLAALFMPDGRPTLSDGVSVHVKITDVKGRVSGSDFIISQEDFLRDRWITETLGSADGVVDVSVSIGTGGPGSTPDFDATLVNVTSFDGVAWVSYVGMLFVLVYAVLIVAYSLVQVLSRFKRKVGFSSILYIVSVVVLFVGVTAWSHFYTNFVYFWDYLNYWEKSRQLLEVLQSDGWVQAVAVIGANYSADYSMLPAVLPAMLGLILGGLSRTEFAIIITFLYAVPAYLLLVYMAQKLVWRQGYPSPAEFYPLLPAVAIFFGLPFFFGTVIYLMPDIGGVTLLGLSIIIALNASRLISSGRSEDVKVFELVKVGVLLGFLVSLMFLYRRWYVFGAVGVLAALGVLCVRDIIVSKGAWFTVFRRCCVSAFAMSMGALPLLCWVLFSWSRDLASHDYSNLYSSYKNTLQYDLNYFVSAFGMIVPCFALISVAVLLRRYDVGRLVFLLVFSTATSVVLFLHVQSPGRHHLYLLMPLLGSLIAALIMHITRFYSAKAGLAVVLVLAGLPLYGLESSGTDNTPSRVVASYKDWLPKQQPYAKGYEQISRWLVRPENAEKKFCLIASSKDINQGIFSQLWQVEPFVRKDDFAQRLVGLPQVDSTDGPPSKAMRLCDIFLVATPFQSHMRPGQQLNMQLVQEDILAHTGVGRFMDPMPSQIFEMSADVKIIAFKRRDEFSPSELELLIKRFLTAKENEGAAVSLN